MKPVLITLTGAALDRDGVCQSQTAGGAGNLTINGALASGGAVTFDVPRRVGVYSTGDHSARTITFTGTDRRGDALVQAIAGPNNSTVETPGCFASVTRVATDGALGTAVEVGTTASIDSQWVPLDPKKSPFSVSMSFTLSSGASITYGVEWTLMPVGTLRESEVTRFHPHASAYNKSATYAEQTAIAGPASAYRITASVTSGTLYGYFCQAG